MKPIIIAITAVAAIIATGCASTGVNLNKPLDPIRQQIEACGAGFGSTLQANLVAQYDIKKSELSGSANAGIEASATTAAYFISALPDKDKLDGYKTYVSCLEQEINYPKGSAPLQPEALQLAIDVCSGNDLASTEEKEPRVQMYSLDDLTDKVFIGDSDDSKRLRLADSYHRCLEKVVAAL